MKLIVGLGNPGEKFKGTRHNVGFMVVDKLSLSMNAPSYIFEKKFDAETSDRRPVAFFVKPHTMMNSSGESVKKLVNFYKIYIPDIWVIHDDLDIKLGQYKIQQGHGPRLHYGVNSIEEKLGSEAFWRVRIGVDNRDFGNRIPGEEYVLQNFLEEEKKIVDGVIDKVLQELLTRFKS